MCCVRALPVCAQTSDSQPAVLVQAYTGCAVVVRLCLQLDVDHPESKCACKAGKSPGKGALDALHAPPMALIGEG